LTVTVIKIGLTPQRRELWSWTTTSFWSHCWCY